MIYSVWNQGAGAFDYYKSAKAQEQLNTEKPRHIANRALGSTVEQAAWPLPPVVRHIGSGPNPVGRIAVRNNGLALGAIGDDLPLVKAGLLFVAGMLAVKYLLPRHR